MEIKVIVHGDNDYLVCFANEFNEDDKGVLRMKRAWEISRPDFQGRDRYVVNRSGDVVYTACGKEVDYDEARLRRNVSVKSYNMYYEDDIQKC